MKSPKSGRASGKGATIASRRKKPQAAPAGEVTVPGSPSAEESVAGQVSSQPQYGSGSAPDDDLDYDIAFDDEFDAEPREQDEHVSDGATPQAADLDAHEEDDLCFDKPFPCEGCGGDIADEDFDCFVHRTKEDGGEELICLCVDCRRKQNTQPSQDAVRISKRKNDHFYRLEEGGDYRLVSDMDLCLHFLGKAASPAIDRVREHVASGGFLWGAGFGILLGLLLF